MRILANHNEYLGLVNKAFTYEDLWGTQQALNALVARDKSHLANFQAILKELDDMSHHAVINLVDIDVVTDDDNMTVAAAKKAMEQKQEAENKKQAYYFAVNNWDTLMADVQIINQLLAVSLLHKDKIEHETLKFHHKIQQSMNLGDIASFKDEFARRLKADLSSYGVDFSFLNSKRSELSQDEILRLKREQEAKEAKLQEQLKRKAEEQAELEQKLKEAEEAKRKAEEAKRKAEEEAIRKANEETAKKAEQDRINAEQEKPKPPPTPIKSDPPHIHEPLQANKNSLTMECPKCGKQYASHYTVCLKDGTKLNKLNKSFGI